MGRSRGLAKGQRRALDRLRAIQGIDGFYLAGGSAVALHLGHRRSNDLDLFSLSSDVDLAAVGDGVRTALDDARLLSQSDAALRMIVGGALVDIVRYPYPLLEPPQPGPGGFALAGLRDLAAMKLGAIARRGLKRDFWDLFAIAESGVSLAMAIDAYVARFGVKEADLYHLMRSLTYFADADAEETYPSGLSEAAWKRIKLFFRKEAPKLLDRRA